MVKVFSTKRKLRVCSGIMIMVKVITAHKQALTMFYNMVVQSLPNVSMVVRNAALIHSRFHQRRLGRIRRRRTQERLQRQVELA